jgi:Na+/H+-dicarboxylate symporter
MFGTVVNILGDAVAAVYVAKKEGQIDEKKYHTVTWIS